MKKIVLKKTIVPLLLFLTLFSPLYSKKKMVVIMVHGTTGIIEKIANIFWLIRNILYIPQCIYHLKKGKRNKIIDAIKESRWNSNIEKKRGIIGNSKGMHFLISATTEDREHPYGNMANIKTTIPSHAIKIVEHFLTNFFTNEALTKEYDAVDWYLYNWSGTLFTTDRAEESKEFFKELLSLQHTYDADSVDYCIIAHSHGGTMVLNIANEGEALPVPIRYLFLLGTPMFPQNSNAIKKNFPSPTEKQSKQQWFNNIISIYSEGDRVQASDITIPQVKKTTKKITRSLIEEVNTNKTNPHLYQFRVYYQRTYGNRPPQGRIKRMATWLYALLFNYRDIIAPSHGNLVAPIEKKKQYLPPVVAFIPPIISLLQKLHGEETLTIFFPEKNALEQNMNNFVLHFS